MTATNGIGFEVQEYRRDFGWSRVSEIFATIEEAKDFKIQIASTCGELRVYESLDFPVQVLPYLGKSRVEYEYSRRHGDFKPPFVVGNGCKTTPAVIYDDET